MQTKNLLFGFIIIALFISVIADSIESSNLGAKGSETESLINSSQDIDSRPVFQRDPAHSGHSSSEVQESNKTLWMTERDDYPTMKGVAAAANPTEALDQQQTNTSRFVMTKDLGESFKPKLTILTSVELYLAITTGDATLWIYSSITTENGLRPDRGLGSAYFRAPDHLPRWVKFIFNPPISLLSENTYFLIIIGEEIETRYASMEDLYPRGEAYLFYGRNWQEWQSCPWDFAFKTYGYTPTLTIHTSGVSSHSPIMVTLNELNAGMVYDANPLEVSDNIPWIDGYGTLNIGIDRTRISSIDPNMRYFFSSWTGPAPATVTSTDNPLTIYLYENASYTANFKTQYLMNMTFRDNSGTINLDPTYIEALAPDSSLVTLSSFVNQWMDNGAWALKRVIWQGNNVKPLTDSICNPTAGATWNINCRVFLVNLTDSFKDNNGADLYVKPSSFRLAFPNSTTSASLPLGSYLIQNGTTFWTSIIWEGSEVTPNTYFDANDGNPIVKCKVYSLAVNPNFYDNTGATLIQPSSWSLRFPNGTVRTLSTPVTYNQTQAGSYSIESVVWKGLNVLWQPASIFITSNNTWSPKIVCALPSNLSLSLSSSTSYVVVKIEISGNLTYNEKGILSAPILLSYSATSGQSWNDITLINTTSNGRYSAVWMPQATGNYLVRAIWAGNSTFPRASTTVNLAVTAFEGKNVFAVESNSTISALAFNATSLELSFTVSGENGTRGYVKVTIAKSLISNIADVKVYLDGNQTEYSATSQDDSWILTFTYTHSTRHVTINLKTAITTGISPYLTPWIYLIAAVIVIALISGIIIMRRRKKPKKEAEMTA